MVLIQGFISETWLDAHGLDYRNFCVILQNKWEFSVLFKKEDVKLEFKNSNKKR